PGRRDAGDHGHDGVRGGAQHFTVLEEGEGLQAEGGKRGVTAAEPHHEKGADDGLGGGAGGGCGEGGKQADHEGTRDVDEERSRERRARGTRRAARSEPSRETSEPTAQENPESRHTGSLEHRAAPSDNPPSPPPAARHPQARCQTMYPPRVMRGQTM